MTVEFTREWRGHAMGEVCDVGDGVGEAYITRGVARLIESARTQTIPNAVQTVVAAVKRGRGRPRKNVCLTS